MKEVPYVAHVDSETKRTQSLSSHLLNVSRLSEENCPLDILKNLVWLNGILHDCGKVCDEFQSYMNDVLEHGKETRKRHIDHSTAGGKIAETIKGNNLCGKMISTAVYSHHGIQDCISIEHGVTLSEMRNENLSDFEKILECYFGFVNKELLERRFQMAMDDVNHMLKQISDEVKIHGKEYGHKYFYFGMYERLLLSVLIDSDWSDTVSFFDETSLPVRFTIKETKRIWEKSVSHFETFLKKLGGKTEQKEDSINRYRQKISEACRSAADCPGCLYRLTVPTGAGKTFSSLRFALHHAGKFGKKHIIYVAPYNSILEQNAKEIRKAVGMDEIVLEHHCNVVYEDEKEELKYRKLTETWDSPIIVTTAVQVLNTLFSDRKSYLRRMHQLCNSIIIFDEIQAIPTRCTELFHLAVNFLTAFCNTTVVLCSATQPSLAPLPENRIFDSPEMAGDVERYAEVFQRTVIEDKTDLCDGGMEIEDLEVFVWHLFQKQKSILIIVNTKKCARDLYELLKSSDHDEAELYHLSTNMCARNRQEELEEIKKALKLRRPIICVSTQLVEAGVDFSFSTVIRSMAGLDSVVQAAGRCNRHKEFWKLCKVYIVRMSAKAENLSHLTEIRDAQSALEKVLYQYRIHPEYYDKRLDSQKAIEAYYKNYFSSKTEETKYPRTIGNTTINLVDLLSWNRIGQEQFKRKHKNQPIKIPLVQAFKMAGELFEVIPEDEKVTVVVPYDSYAKQAIEKLRDPYLKLSEQRLELRKLQSYTVGISLQKKEKLNNAIDSSICKGAVSVLVDGYYDKKVGVLDSPKLDDLFFGKEG